MNPGIENFLLIIALTIVVVEMIITWVKMMDEIWEDAGDPREEDE